MRTLSTRTLAVAAACLAGGPAAWAQYSTPMRNVENPDRFPYVQSGTTTISANVVNGFIFFPTPAGKRVVVEHVAVQCTSQSASGDTFTQTQLRVLKPLSPTSFSELTVAFIPLQRRGPAFFGGTLWTGNEPVTAIGEANPFDPTGGTGLSLNIFRADASGVASCYGALTGHLFTP